ncbi:oxidoreductase [Prosthecomicrobium hirschii]|uniref:Oxidoreductase n=1 Tax=Prosthecodimorpha hirschii TaxID=665126 RepID=A0A0P6VRE7_9HYPH|nr:SDR family NAD(P)-dependent oxidoreductase [Prosthecomicrobium hirschii]KPL55317.1 oxidoreductase [Prosthecomicrobium hirschii]
MSDKPLNDRIVVVTGASRGIGRAVALEIARAGAHVVAVARTVGGLEELDDAILAVGGTATLVPLDLKDFDAIDRLGAALYGRFGRIDGLVGNAGVLGVLTPLGHVDVKVWDEVMAVNVTANWRLIRSFDPLLKQSGSGRALFVTSGAARKRSAYWGPYSISKAALEAMVATYAREGAIAGIKANLINPGPIRTAMREKAMPGEDAATLPAAEELAPYFVPLLGTGLVETGRVWDFPSRSWLPE